MFRISLNNITITQGDTAVIQFTVHDYELTTGDTVYFSVKEKISDVSYVLQKTITSFTTGGLALIELSSTDTDLTPGKYKYDIQCSLADGRVDTVIGTNEFTVLAGVTSD